MDPFVVYENLYKSIREAVNDAMYGNQMEVLAETTQVKALAAIC